MYENYKTARDKAWAVLIENEVTSFPVNIKKIIVLHDISLLSFESAGATFFKLHYTPAGDALSIIINGEKCIFYKSNPETRLRFTLAHELGHFMLNHVKENEIALKYSEDDEAQANVFASRLLMPSIVLREEKLTTVKDIANFCHVSYEAAAVRHERMQILLQRDRFLEAPLERQYYHLYMKNKNSIK